MALQVGHVIIIGIGIGIIPIGPFAALLDLIVVEAAVVGVAPVVGMTPIVGVAPVVDSAPVTMRVGSGGVVGSVMAVGVGGGSTTHGQEHMSLVTRSPMVGHLWT